MATGRARDGNRAPAGAGSAMDLITSRDNRWLKSFRVALRGGVPTESGAVGVEGVRLVEEALTSGCRVEAVLFGESGERHRERLAPFVGRAEVGFPVLRTTDRLFEGVADTEHPQGVAALVVPRAWTLEDALDGSGLLGLRASEWRSASAEAKADKVCTGEKKLQDPPSRTEGGAPATAGGQRSAIGDQGTKIACAPLIVVLAGVQDPGNVGATLRAAAAFGATAAVTAATGQSGSASPYAPKALRASAGAALHMPIVSGMALGILLTQLKVRGIRTLASCVGEQQWRVAGGEWRENLREILSAKDAERGRGLHSADSVRNALTARPSMADRHDNWTAKAPWEVDWCEAVALLVGNEGAGLPDDVVQAADQRIHIPMASGVESLNAAAAAAVVLYEAFRQRTRRATAGDE